MKLMEKFSYRGKQVTIYEDDAYPLELANPIYRVFMDDQCISDDHPMPGPTLDLLREEVKTWINTLST